MKKKKIIIFVISGIIVMTISLILPKIINNTYAIGTTLADTVKALNKGNGWSSGASGVYYTNSHEYRYVGANVNNYVSFNNDLYRIIGVFDENSHGVSGKELVKLIRSRSIGSYTWGIYNTTSTSGEYSNSKNDWTGNRTGVKANLNVLLNEFFYNKTDTSDEYGICGDWTYYTNATVYRTNDCSNIVGYGIDSDVRSYIQDVTWYLYGYNDTAFSKQDFYLCERGQSTDTTNCKAGYNGIYSASTIEKIGLMYPSDFFYASGYLSSNDTTVVDDVQLANRNWLYKGLEYTIMPGASNANYAFYITGTSPNISVYNMFFSRGVRPTFYLKSSVYVTGGDGSFDNPFTIACDDCE